MGDDDKQIKYENLRSAISKQFHLFCQYTLYEDVDGDQCEAEDMDEIIELFGDDDEGKRTLDLIVKVDSLIAFSTKNIDLNEDDDPPIVSANYPLHQNVRIQQQPYNPSNDSYHQIEQKNQYQVPAKQNEMYKLAESFKKSNDALNKKLVEVQEKSKQELAAMKDQFDKFNNNKNYVNQQNAYYQQNQMYEPPKQQRLPHQFDHNMYDKQN